MEYHFDPDHKCPSCGKEETKIVRMTEEDKPSVTTAYVCANEHCSLKIDLSKVNTWKKV